MSRNGSNGRPTVKPQPADLQPPAYEAAKRAMGIEHGLSPLFESVVEQGTGDPMIGLLDSVNRGLGMLRVALQAKGHDRLETEDVVLHLFDFQRSLDAAEQLYWRVIDRLAATAPGGSGSVLPTARKRAGSVSEFRDERGRVRFRVTVRLSDGRRLSRRLPPSTTAARARETAATLAEHARAVGAGGKRANSDVS